MPTKYTTNSNLVDDKNSLLSIKKAADKLYHSELRYRRLFETAQDGILILDANSGKITDANPFLKKILGYTQAELLGKELWQIGVFKDIVNSKVAFRRLQDKGYIRYKDLPLETKDGRSIDVEFVSNVYMVASDKVIQCNIRDITSRKSAETALKSRTKQLEVLTKTQEEAKLAMLNVMEDLEAAKNVIEVAKAKDEAMLASIGEGLIAVDNDRKVIVINKAAETMLGWKMKDVVGKEVTSLPLEDEEGRLLPLTKRPTYKAITTGKMVNSTYYFVRKDKTRFPIAIVVTPIKMGGKIIGAIDIFRDISREIEIDRAKSEFVSLASHQLRTPLGIAKWYIEALNGEGYMKNIPKVARGYLDQVYKSNERLLTLVRDLLSISRIDQGKVRDNPKLTKIPELIRDIVKAMNILAAKSQVTIELDFKKRDIPELYIDHLRLQEMIENLLTNAILYSLPQGKVKVIVDTKDDMLVISVQDNGIGIAKEDKRKLFTKFFRSGQAMAKNAEGSGLGLYVVKSYIEGWGGTITVQSAMGKGSTFTVSLPLKMKKNKKEIN